jgi:cation:H+ antiporter
MIGPAMVSLGLTVGLLLAAAAVIYLACEYFVNGVEWVGHRLAVSQKATGTILAAFGTALPECVVTFAAVVFGRTPDARQLGVGAALGGPLVLATLAYAVVGMALLATKRPLAASTADARAFGDLSRDQLWFLAIFIVKLGLGLAVFAWKPWLAAAFVAAYGAYVWRETRSGEAGPAPDLEPLKLSPGTANPSLHWAAAQTLGALVVIYFASRLFVSRMETLGPVLGLRPQLLSMLVSPIATELPEILNAVIWIRQGKTALALANISGAMMIQATIPSALGLAFTPWRLDPAALIGGAITALAMTILALAFGRRLITRTLLIAMAGGYVVFLALTLTPSAVAR